MVDLYNLILVPWQDLKSTPDIRASTFLHDQQTRHKPNTKLLG
jgi:hypothetical protein